MRRSPRFSIIMDVKVGERTHIADHVNLYKCKIGKNCKVESFVYIEEAVTVGDYSKIKPHTFIPAGVTIEDHVFIGPHVTFSNDKYPRATGNWKLVRTTVKSGASIGANSVVLPGITIGRNALIGSGSVVTRNVPDNATVYGNPAKQLRPKFGLLERFRNKTRTRHNTSRYLPYTVGRLHHQMRRVQINGRKKGSLKRK